MKILYSKSAVKSINGMDKTLKQRIRSGILKLPLGDIKKLKGFKNSYRLRIGNYRVLYDVLENDIILINDILPRGEAYKNL